MVTRVPRGQGRSGRESYRSDRLSFLLEKGEEEELGFGTGINYLLSLLVSHRSINSNVLVRPVTCISEQKDRVLPHTLTPSGGVGGRSVSQEEQDVY